MYFGLTLEKLLLILVIAVLVVGPVRLPTYAAALARLVTRGKEFMQATTSQLREELGPEFDEVDWHKLDPRQYDPRRIVRQALLDDEPDAPSAAAPPRPPAV